VRAAFAALSGVHGTDYPLRWPNLQVKEVGISPHSKWRAKVRFNTNSSPAGNLATRAPDNNASIRRLIQWVGVAGTTVFGLLLALAFLRPVTIEQWARAAIVIEVQSRVAERLPALDDSTLAQSAQRIVLRNDREIAEEVAALQVG